MRTTLARRLRAPLIFCVGAAAAVVVRGVAYGWNGVPDVVPVLILVTVALFVVGSRDSDAGAVVRRETDERQAQQRLQVQALVGRVMAVAVAIAYLVAVATKSMLWPYGALLGVLAVAFVGGWLRYGERSGDRNDGA